MKNIKLLLTTAVFATLTSCVNGDDYNTPDLSGECITLTVSKDVQDITSIASTTPTQYVESDIIEAYVTSSDEGGNFYKSISMVSTDEQIGFTIPVDSYNLYTKFEPGRLVYINMENLYYAYTSQTSSYEIGNLYNGTQIGRLSGVEFQNIDNLNEPYTGYFNKQQDIEAVLNFVCKPFNIEYKKLPSGVYTIQ